MDKQFEKIQRVLSYNKKLSNYNYRGERTFVVVSGLNSDSYNLSQVKGLDHYEERMLFFLFLLKYKRTKIIYVTSKNFNTKLFDYYISLISNDPKEIKSIKSRLKHIEVTKNYIKPISLTERLLNDEKALRTIKENIFNAKTAVLRCYYPSEIERKLALKLNMPLFGSKEKFDYVGTKSGSRKVFRLTGLNLIPGYSYLKSFPELRLAMAKLMKNHPYYKRLVIKLDQCASGRGNCIFNVKDFLNDYDIEISVKTDVQKLAKKIKLHFKEYASFQQPEQKFGDYVREFNRIGGIVELFIPGEIKYSPSVQVYISAEKKAKVISTHEQILGGVDKQKYLGCSFPSLPEHRKIIIKEAKKVADWMAKKGMIGHFGVDFIVTHNIKTNKVKTHPIEINLRKGGTTHPFRIAFYLTRAKYDSKKGILFCGKLPIHYQSMDLIESENYKGIDPMKLVELVHNSSISFNENNKKGALVYMPGMAKEFGRFGALAIGHSTEETKRIYNKMIRLIDANIEFIKN